MWVTMDSLATKKLELGEFETPTNVVLTSSSINSQITHGEVTFPNNDGRYAIVKETESSKKARIKHIQGQLVLKKTK